MKRRRLGAEFFLLCTLSIFAESVFAGGIIDQEEADNAASVLETTVVEASALQDLPGSVNLINETEIHDVGAVHPAELLARVPGAWVSRGGGQEQLIALRSPVWTGSGSCGEIVVAEDGVPIRPAGFCNVNQLLEINTEQSGGMEVLRGTQGGSFYGANAVHGVINVQTLPLEDRHSISVEGGPNDYARSLWQQGDDNGYLALNASHDGGYQDSSGYDQQKMSWKQQQNLDGVTLTHYVTAVNLDQQSIGYLMGEDAYRDEQLKRENSKPDSYRDVSAFRYVQSWDWQSGSYHNSVKPYFRHSDMDFTQHFVFPEALEKNGHNSGGIQWLFKRDDFGWGSWQGGSDIDMGRAWVKEWQEKPATSFSPQGVHYDYDVNMQTASLWQELTWHMTNRLDGQLGMRADRVLYGYDNATQDGAAGKFMRPADRNDSYNLASPRAGLVYTDRFDNEWYANLSISNRAPQTAELYRLQGKQQSADIGVESAEGGEVGWRGHLVQDAGGNMHWNITAFDMHKDNVIIRNVSNVLSDDAKTSHRGMEVGLQQDWASGWYADLAATYAEHRYDSDVFDGIKNVDGNIIDTAPRTMGSVQFGWKQDAISVECEWLHMGNYYLNPQDTFTYDGHDLLNLRGRYSVAKDRVIFSRLMNVTNVDYAERADVAVSPVVEPRYFVGLPRSLYLGVEWSY